MSNWFLTSEIREFPTEYLDKTLNEIEKDEKAGNAAAKKAKNYWQMAF